MFITIQCRPIEFSAALGCSGQCIALLFRLPNFSSVQVKAVEYLTFLLGHCSAGTRGLQLGQVGDLTKKLLGKGGQGAEIH